MIFLDKYFVWGPEDSGSKLFFAFSAKKATADSLPAGRGRPDPQVFFGNVWNYKNAWKFRKIEMKFNRVSKHLVVTPKSL